MIAEPDVQAAAKVREAREKIRGELAKVIVGQEQVIDEMLIALLSRGHALLVGVPGLAKTLAVSSMARILDLGFRRIQFTPDLMPSDITGFDIIQDDGHGGRALRFVEGPVFANMILADEINRTPPKTQSALLEAMQENHVTCGGQTRALPLPFFVLATQNPIEQEGTYPLPEAQLDRFFMQINLDYPGPDEEKDIVRMTTGSSAVELSKALSAADVIRLQDITRRVPVSDSVIDKAVSLARMTRPQKGTDGGSVSRFVSWGAGPRASQSLVLAAKARALLMGRTAASQEDVLAIAKPVLRHRVILNFQAEAEGLTSDVVIDRLCAEVFR